LLVIHTQYKQIGILFFGLIKEWSYNIMRKWLSHNQGTFIGIILAVGLLVWTFGCESKVTSPVSNKQVTRSELIVEVKFKVQALEAELDHLQEQAQLGFTDLDKQDTIKRKLFEFAALTAQTGAFNPTGIITLAGTLLGLGFGVDNRIKDKVIKNRPLPTNNTT